MCECKPELGTMARFEEKVQMEYEKRHSDDPAFKTKEAFQRHHDYYVGLHKEGRLTEADRSQYELAIKREETGEVKAWG